MKLLYLHGPPASGKLTIAKAVLKQIPGRLFDNHAAIDLARTVFDFGSEGFWSLVARIRLEVIREAAKHGVPTIVMTSCYSHPQDYETFLEIESAVQDKGGALLPVFLDCDQSELSARVANQDRVDRQKIRNEEDLRGFLNQWNIGPVPRENCHRLRSDETSPSETAARIIQHFGLNP